jgi:hypothetical protein
MYSLFQTSSRAFSTQFSRHIGLLSLSQDTDTSFHHTMPKILGERYSVENLTRRDLNDLFPARYPLLIVPTVSEVVKPILQREEQLRLVNYVRSGGLIYRQCGMPTIHSLQSNSQWHIAEVKGLDKEAIPFQVFVNPDSEISLQNVGKPLLFFTNQPDCDSFSASSPALSVKKIQKGKVLFSLGRFDLLSTDINLVHPRVSNCLKVSDSDRFAALQNILLSHLS